MAFSGVRRRVFRRWPATLLALCLAAVPAAPLEAGFAGGDGTADRPWQVETLAQLDRVRDDPGAHYRLVADIDAAPTAGWDGGAGFRPIGAYSFTVQDPFTGHFDGGGHRITGLAVSRGQENLGLFGAIFPGGVVENLQLADFSIHGDDIFAQGAGALAGWNRGTVSGVRLHGGSVTARGGAGFIGGLVGVNEGTVTDGYAETEISATGMSSVSAGGLVGVNDGEITRSGAAGALAVDILPFFGFAQAGGLVGSGGGLVSDAFAAGAVSVAGGQAELPESVQIGGLIGRNTGTIHNCYAVGPVSGEGTAGGLAGACSGRVTAGYWDTGQTGQAVSAAGQPLDSAAMKHAASFAGWDFAGTWGIVKGAGRPYLRALPFRPAGHVLSPRRREGVLVRGDTLYFSAAPAADPAAEYRWTLPDGTTSGERVPGLVAFPETGSRTVVCEVLVDGAVVTAETRLFEVVSDAAAFPDLVIEDFTAPGEIFPGLVATATYTVRNDGDASAAGDTWRDALYLADGARPDTGSLLLAAVPPPAELLPGESYAGAITFRVPPASPGAWHLALVVNDSWSFAETHRLNNEAARETQLRAAPAAPAVDLPGEGTPAAPYLVSTLAGLARVRHDLDAHYRLTADLEAAVSATWNNGAGFPPLGDSAAGEAFGGRFDGAGHVISGLVIFRPRDDYVGFFDALGARAVVENLVLEDVAVTGDHRVGALAGINYRAAMSDQRGEIRNVRAGGAVTGRVLVGGLVGNNGGLITGSAAAVAVCGRVNVGGLAGGNDGRIVDSRASGPVTGVDRVGGLVGGGDGGLITGCRASGPVTGEEKVGGLVGRASGELTDSAASGEVRGKNLVGGLAGESRAVLLSACFASGPVTGEEAVGGLVGEHAPFGERPLTESFATGAVSGLVAVGGLVGRIDRGSEVVNCYATGAVSGENGVGGLVGMMVSHDVPPVPSVVRNCYAAGPVTGDEHAGGLVGLIIRHPAIVESQVSASCWDTLASGQQESDGGQGRTTAEMMRRATYAGWDFDLVWAIEEGAGYPWLRAVTLPPAARITSPARGGTLVRGDALRFRAAPVDDPAATWRWSFSDGRIARVREPGLVTFAETGEFQVTLAVVVDGQPLPDEARRHFTVIDDAPPRADLEITAFDLPGAPRAGEPFTVSYTVRNSGDGPVAGAAWRDALFLSPDPWPDTADRLLAEAAVEQELAPGESYAGELTFTMPAVAGGAHYLLLAVNDDWAFPERRRLNNERAAAILVDIPGLTDGDDHAGIAGPGTFSDVFRITLPAARDLRLTLTGPEGLEFYLRFGAIPGRDFYDYHAPDRLLVSGAYAGDWFVVVTGENLPGEVAYTIRYETVALALHASSPARHVVDQPLELNLSGTGFDHAVEAALVGAGGEYPAASVAVHSSARLTARFEPPLPPPGVYGVRLARPDIGPAQLEAALEILPGGAAELRAGLILPDGLGVNTPATLYVEYENTGDLTMPAPLLSLTALDNGFPGALLSLDAARLHRGFWTAGQPEKFAGHVQFLASGEVPGLLQPGEKGRVAVHYIRWRGARLAAEWQLGVLGSGEMRLAPDSRSPQARVMLLDGGVSMDWPELKEEMRPAFIAADAWDQVWDNFVARAGDTRRQFLDMLNRHVRYLARLGRRVDCVNELVGFSLRLADGQNIMPVLAAGLDALVEARGPAIAFERLYLQPVTRRFARGPLGRGWAHNWQYALEKREDGTVLISDLTGTPRIFQPDSRAPGRGARAAAPRNPAAGQAVFGRYFAEPGDWGRLGVMPDGTYGLAEHDGRFFAFRADGRLASVEDLNGNRISCVYDGDRLVRLEHSSGGFLEITWRDDGLIGRVTDPHGRATAYDYDGEYLVAVEGSDGRVTTYDYNMYPHRPHSHALRRVGFPDGIALELDYDARGRLLFMTRDGTETPFHFNYENDAGTIWVTDPLDRTATFCLDQGGRLARFTNADRQTVQFSSDELGRLVRVTDPKGFRVEYAYDGPDLTRMVDQLGRATEFRYGGFGRLSRLTEPGGQETRYRFDSHGNLESITWPDGSRQGWSGHVDGLPGAWTNRRGQARQYTWDDAGRLTRVDCPADGVAEYRYDEAGFLREAENAYGTIAFFRDDDDYLRRVEYPGGRRLEFDYDAGRRTLVSDELGNEVHYEYDGAGRLELLRDRDGAVIVRYEYHDPAGRLTRAVTPAGSTRYEYDGRLTAVINRDRHGNILSRFDYEYDRIGRRRAKRTHYGDWTYTYDEAGQLTGARLVSSDPDLPDQDLVYEYDQRGNRVRTVENGRETIYRPDGLNRYERAGDTVFTWDADGNLVAEAGPGGVITYAYDAENRLVGVSRGEDAVTFTYDALGNRVRSEDQHGRRTEYVYDPAGLGNLAAAYDQAGVQAARFFHGHGLVGRVSADGERAWYTFDLPGSVSELVGADGAPRNRYAYCPFGRLLREETAVADPFGFVGQLGVMADVAGLNHMRARHYHPRLGRFTSPDPINLDGGDPNLYRYVFNSPLDLVDPFGLSVCLTASGALGVAGGVKTAGFGAKLTGAAIIAAPATGGVTLGVAGVGLMLYGVYSAGRGLEEMGQGMRGRGTTNFADQVSRPFDPMNVALDHGKHHLNNRAHRQAPQSFSRNARIPDPRRALLERGAVGAVCSMSKLAGLPGPLGDFLRGFLLPFWLACDPNQKLGPAGHGEANHVAAGTPLAYRVDFENLEDADVPAQIVTITDPLSAHLDWSTFEFTQVGFGELVVPLAPGTRQYRELVDYVYRDDEYDMDIVVEIRAEIDPRTGLVSVSFFSLADREIGLPPPVNLGLLPPEDGSGRGQGYFTYLVRPRADLPSGTAIRNVATIQFDYGLEIDTNQVDPLDKEKGTSPDLEALVTIDSAPPASRVDPLPAVQASETFTVAWQGDDGDGSGVRGFDLFVRENGGDWTPWLSGTTLTAADYPGADGREYAFYALATDHVGNREEKAPAAEALTRVDTTVRRLAVSPGVRFASSLPGQVAFEVASTAAPGMDWTAAVTAGGSWLEIVSGAAGTDGGGVVLAAAANPAAEKRVGEITVSAPGALDSPQVVTVTQFGEGHEDITLTGAVTLADVIQVLRWVADPPAGDPPPGDVDGDGRVTVEDAAWILRRVLGRPSSR